MGEVVAHVIQLRTGVTGELDRASVGRSGTVASALGKIPREGPVALGECGFDGDTQADRKNHGGPQKAVLAYPAEHYPLWLDEFGRDLSDRGLGENLRTGGLDGAAWDERAVRPGDVFRIGTAVVQVTAPRRPCYKLGLAHGVTQMPVRVQATGRTGFYLSVLEPGRVCAGDEILLVEHAAHDVTAFEVNRVMNVDKRDAGGIRHVLKAREHLPERWTEKLRSRLAALESTVGTIAVTGADEDGARLYGSA